MADSANPDDLHFEGPDNAIPPVPTRAAYLTSFAAVVLAGLFGATIGYGIVDVSCTGDCGAATASGAVVGAMSAAIGVGVIAVLVLRAMAEWKRTPPDVRARPRPRGPS